jgi:hypothetical protein
MLGLIAFYSYACARGLRRAQTWLCAILLLACWTGSRTTGWSTLASVQWWPLAVIGMIQLWWSLARRSSWHCFLAATLFTTAAVTAMWHTPNWVAAVIVGFHVVLMAALLAGVFFPDRHAVKLRLLAAVLTVCAGFAAFPVGESLGVSEIMRINYVSALVVGACQCRRAWREPWWLAAAGCNLLAELVMAGSLWGGYVYRALGPGCYALLLGILFFVIAGLISAQKCGWLKTIWEWLASQCVMRPRGERRVVARKPGG